MLKALKVKNFALIEALELELEPGFTVITGETGAGKSILLGALSHLLGARADLKALRNKDQKCIIEGDFDLKATQYPALFESLDLDYEALTIIRREILPSGKSRAFVNDSPVRLDQLSALSAHLIDIHSQHDTLLLRDKDYQLELLDAYGGHRAELNNYKELYQNWRSLKDQLNTLLEKQRDEGGDRDYLQFLFDELEAAKLVPGEQEELEQKLELLEHAGTIEEKLQDSLRLADGEPLGISELLRQLTHNFSGLSTFDKRLNELFERVNSLQIEFEDLRQEIEAFGSDSNFDPREREQCDQRLSEIISLQKKHQVDSLEGLIGKKEEIELKIVDAESRIAEIEELERSIEQQFEQLEKAAKKLRDRRLACIPDLVKSMQALLADLNLEAAQFEIKLEAEEQFRINGKDRLSLLFSANPGQAVQVLSKVASGGELSRVMLALKALLSRSKSLATIIFDEIDTGVSGETAIKIAQILKEMGQNLQVISISHLAQIASKANQHLKVEKVSSSDSTATHLRILDPFQREQEIARLLSGDAPSEAALANARALLEV